MIRNGVQNTPKSLYWICPRKKAAPVLINPTLQQLIQRSLAILKVALKRLKIGLEYENGYEGIQKIQPTAEMG